MARIGLRCGLSVNRPASVTMNSGRPGPAAHVDGAAVRLDDGRDDRQAEAGAAAAPGARRVAAREPLEDLGLQPLRDAGAVVGDRQHGAAVAVDRANDVVTEVPGGVWVRALASRLAST